MRLIDADKVIIEIVHKYGREQGDAILEIDGAPIIDAVQVVRCKDCKYRITETFDEPACEIVRDCGGYNATVKDNDYCSWGERREDAEKTD